MYNQTTILEYYDIMIYKTKLKKKIIKIHIFVTDESQTKTNWFIINQSFGPNFFIFFILFKKKIYYIGT